MRVLSIIFCLSLLGCSSEIKSHSDPDYQIALNFINEYTEFINQPKSEQEILNWIESHNSLTDDFKKEVTRVISDARLDDPELGLGFDPILDAQDYPENGFEIAERDSVFLTVRGVEWPEFRLALKLKWQDDFWLVDGSGIINIPINHRIKR
jgi:hypothetical protein